MSMEENCVSHWMVYFLFILNLVTAHSTLAKFWESVVILMIGGSLIKGEDLCGARILDKVCVLAFCDIQSKFRKNNTIEYRLEIWFKDWNNESFKSELQSRVNDICKEYDYKPVITFERHDPSKWQ